MSATDLSAKLFLERIGCQVCQRRPRGAGGWVLQPCRSCRTASKGLTLLEQVQSQAWVITLDELAGYLAKKVLAAPWVAIDWGGEAAPSVWAPAIAIAFRDSESFGPAPKIGDQTYLCPAWLSLFLAAGTWVWKMKGVPDGQRPNWPQVLDRACADETFRKGLETCIVTSLATAPDTGAAAQPVDVIRKLFPRGQDEASKNQRNRSREYVAPRIIELLQTAHPELLGVERARKARQVP